MDWIDPAQIRWGRLNDRIYFIIRDVTIVLSFSKRQERKLYFNCKGDNFIKIYVSHCRGIITTRPKWF